LSIETGGQQKKSNDENPGHKQLNFGTAI